MEAPGKYRLVWTILCRGWRPTGSAGAASALRDERSVRLAIECLLSGSCAVLSALSAAGVSPC